MEFAAPSFKIILGQIGSLIFNQVGLICSVDGELRSLQRTLSKVQVMVEYLENHATFVQGINYPNGGFKMFLQDVERFTYDADDLLDSIFLQLPANSKNTDLLNDDIYDQVYNMVMSCPTKLDIPNKIKKLKEDIEIIATQMESLPKLDLSMNEVTSLKSWGDSSIVNYTSIIGREDKKRELITLLLVESMYNVSVVPIVGMGGIGKTTLTQLAYNDVNVRDTFKLRMWVSLCVKRFDLIKITKSIIESVTETSCNLSDLNPLQAKLQNLLKGKKFLLVLDNIWSENSGDWDILFTSLQVGCNGSRVIVTTRSEIVSSIVGKGLVYKVELLTDEQCWKVMEQKSFSDVNLIQNENLSEIGRNIAKKCKGLPLAAKTLGSVLQFKSTDQDYISILESELWDLPGDTNEIYQSLALSYHHLPGHLKKCFAYCSIFPRSYKFEVDDLVLHWMAEGLLWPRGQMRLEDVGIEYFMDLARRSFFDLCSSSVDGVSTKKYVMHDLIHDLSHLVSINTCFPLKNNFSKYYHVEFKNPRHLSLQFSKLQPVNWKTPNWFKNLRTFILFCERNSCIGLVSDDLFAKLKSLRVLNLRNAGIDQLPRGIKNIHQLRYLNLSRNNIKALPKDVTKLRGLQTLKLNECPLFSELPENFQNLTDLRHLDLDVKDRIQMMPAGMGRLTKLQSLSAFIVGTEEGCSISQLKNMQLLRGSLCITSLDNVSSATDARGASLDEKPYIEKLTLAWKHIKTTGDDQIEILQNLKPHKNVKELVIEKYSGSSFPFWLTDPLSRFTLIELRACKNCVNLPSLGLLRFLKALYIGFMPMLVSIGPEFCGNANDTSFPALETLTLEGMPELKELDINGMPNLHELTIMDCGSLVGLPILCALNALDRLNLVHCPELESLPEGGLPKSVEKLFIMSCPKIEERCSKDGEDWGKIKHVKKIEVNYHPLEHSTTEIRLEQFEFKRKKNGRRRRLEGNGGL